LSCYFFYLINVKSSIFEISYVGTVLKIKHEHLANVYKLSFSKIKANIKITKEAPTLIIKGENG